MKAKAKPVRTCTAQAATYGRESYMISQPLMNKSRRVNLNVKEFFFFLRIMGIANVKNADAEQDVTPYQTLFDLCTVTVSLYTRTVI